MTELIFVDTNVLLYWKSEQSTTKRTAATQWIEAILEAGAGRISYQVLVEYQANVARVSPGTPPTETRETVRRLYSWEPVAVDSTILESAWRIQDRYGISWWDALIVAAAETAGCEYLLTEDLQDGQRFGAVTVVDPFVHEPAGYVG